MGFNRKACIKAVITTLVFTTVALLGVETPVDADTNTKVLQGVVLKTSSLKVDKVIVSPKMPKAVTVSKNDDVSRGLSSAVNLINNAYKFIGTPYVYGACGPNTFDCSGFTKYVYSMLGISIPRTSQTQYGYGTVIGKENLKIGDLVFFNTYSYHGHVGIYIGNGDFIHASSSRGVMVSSLQSGYYNTRYAGATRVNGL